MRTNGWTSARFFPSILFNSNSYSLYKLALPFCCLKMRRVEGESVGMKNSIVFAPEISNGCVSLGWCVLLLFLLINTFTVAILSSSSSSTTTTSSSSLFVYYSNTTQLKIQSIYLHCAFMPIWHKIEFIRRNRYIQYTTHTSMTCTHTYIYMPRVLCIRTYYIIFTTNNVDP